MNYVERHLEARQARRMASDSRFLDRYDRREVAADAMVGELNSGKLYIYPVGGRYREGSRSDLIAFLMRNNYV